MFSIGEFARHGRVSVRMLRHYDAIGLLQPACVDPVTGYRFYRAGQLADLNRVIALKELGFSLQQVQAILGDRVSAAELRGMLRLRQAEIRAQIDAETTRLNRVEARLLTIEDEARTPVDGVIVNCYLALIYARVGEKDLAFQLLERLLETPGAADSVDYSITINDLKHRWEWDPIRSDPRFQKLLEQPAK